MELLVITYAFQFAVDALANLLALPHHVVAGVSLHVFTLRWMYLLVCSLYSITQLLEITPTTSVCDGPPCYFAHFAFVMHLLA